MPTMKGKECTFKRTIRRGLPTRQINAAVMSKKEKEPAI
jgi:hypothetical protein